MPCHSVTAHNPVCHQKRDITVKTILFSGGLIYLVKKFVGIKLIQWYGWKRIYRLNHRRSRNMMRDLPEDKRAKSRKMMTYYSKMGRTTYDFFVRHPALITNWLYIDRIVTNTLLYIPRKVKLSLHRWLAVQLKLQKELNKSNPMIKYAKQWQGPLTFGIHEMVGYSNVIILSQYILLSIPEQRTLLDAVFVLSNHSDIMALNDKIHERWKNNPQELERKEYVNLLKMKMN